MATRGEWTTGFYDVLKDPCQWMYPAIYPCCHFGDIAEIVDAGDTPNCGACWMYCCLRVTMMSWLMGSIYRTKLRRLFSLPEEPFSDHFLHCFCYPCALTQEYKELENRGIELPFLGWQEHVEGCERRGVEPPIVPSMSR